MVASSGAKLRLPSQALVEQWIDFTTTELDAPLLSWILPILGHWPYDKKVPLPHLHVSEHKRVYREFSLGGFESLRLFWISSNEV